MTNEKYNKPTYRIIIVMAVIMFMFIILIIRLYILQIKNGEEHLNEAKATSLRTIPIESQRGTIYDKWGVPLAENKVVYEIKMDLSMEYDNVNDIIKIFYLLPSIPFRF